MGSRANKKKSEIYGGQRHLTVLACIKYGEAPHARLFLRLPACLPSNPFGNFCCCAGGGGSNFCSPGVIEFPFFYIPPSIRAPPPPTPPPPRTGGEQKIEKKKKKSQIDEIKKGSRIPTSPIDRHLDSQLESRQSRRILKSAKGL